LNEFDLIKTYFQKQPVHRPDVALGIGDDAALVIVPSDHELVVATDLLVSGVHFPQSTDPRSVGHKALAVNLSDMAAMGASPAWITLTLSLPAADPEWLQEFCAGLYALASQFNTALIGGDTTRGPLTVGVQILGTVPRGQARTRAGAEPGDRVYVTGCLGDAALGLALVEGRLDLPAEFREPVITRLNRPVPRIAAGVQLRGIASACIDISDGLLADLGHVLESSKVGARIEQMRIPVSPSYDCALSTIGWAPALSGGDDYELCFTVPPALEPGLRQVADRLGVSFQEIGEIQDEPGLRLIDEHGAPVNLRAAGFDHFR